METCNGYENYPTFNIALWLDSEREHDAMVRTIITEEISAFLAEDSRRNPKVGYAGMTHQSKKEIERRTAVKIQKYVKEITPDLGASFVADLFGWALSHANWEEIAHNALQKD